MKKLYFVFMLLLFATGKTVAQNENNHWQLGNTDVNFSTNPATTSTSGVAIQYGNASISDANGNLLFYTDGKTIWNKNHQIMQNNQNLCFNVEAEQAVIIVPYPGQNKYYVFSEVSDNYIGTGSTNFHRYNYAIVDFSTNPLGSLQLAQNTNGYVSQLRAIIPNNSNYTVEGYSRKGGLTYTKNNLGDTYWLLVDGYDGVDKLFSFKIDSSGLNQTPIISNYISGFAVNDPYQKQRIVLKFSPDNNTLGFLEGNLRPPVQVGGQSIFHTFSFNSTTGQLSNQILIDNDVYNGSNSFEFSSDSQKVYFAHFSVKVKDLLNPTVTLRTVSALPFITNLGTFSTPYKWHIQRDNNNEILIIGDTFNYLKKIDNQNSFSGSTLSSTYLTLNNNFISPNVLPQLIQTLVPPCPTTLVIATNVITGVDKKQASVSIEATNTINSGTGAIYHAPTVKLKPLFYAKTGSAVHIYPVGCSNTFLAKQSQNIKDISNEVTVKQDDLKINGIDILPNPNNGVFKISLKEVSEGNIQITDMFGFTIYKLDFKNQTDFEMNLQEKPKGIYVVKIVSGEQVFTSKIIKN